MPPWFLLALSSEPLACVRVACQIRSCLFPQLQYIHICNVPLFFFPCLSQSLCSKLGMLHLLHFFSLVCRPLLDLQLELPCMFGRHMCVCMCLPCWECSCEYKQHESGDVVTELSGRGWKWGVSDSPCNVSGHVIQELKI